MKRLCLALGVASLTFAISICLYRAWLARNSGSAAVKVEQSTPIAQELTFSGFVFALKTDGVSDVYQASDGGTVSYETKRFSSSKRALEELQRSLQGNWRIIERTPRLDDKGRQVGNRVVAVFNSIEPGNGRACVFSTYANVFARIDGPSLRHVLTFEKQPG